MSTTPRQRIHLKVADIPGKRFEVRHRIDGVTDEGVRLRMPSWVPGSYLMREYAGHVAWVRAESGGRSLPVDKIDKATWEVQPTNVDSLEVVYQVYAPELTVRTSDITEDHAFAHSAGLFLAVVGREHEPIRLEIEPPESWGVHTALREEDGAHYADDFDRLVDCPIEIGPHEVHRFEAGGRPHELVVHGTGNLDVARALEDIRRICQYEIDFFGEAPFDRYLFILHLTHDRGGGLEHADSSALAWPKLRFRPEKEYRKFLTLVAHEYFHVWNVKRIRPEVLLRYDYSREVYTRLLWVFEGITSYYDELIPLRAGCYEPRHHFELLCEHVRSEKGRPGRLVHSLAESSFDTWIKLYRPSPDAPNSQTNYYEKGTLVALLLDLHLRRQSGGPRSLDDVMRHLWSEIHGKGRGVPEGGFGTLVREATGVDVEEFLREHVEKASALDYTQALASVGLQLMPKKKADDEEPKAWIGATISTENGRSVLTHVVHGGPAHTAQLMPGDEIVALDGHRVTGDLEERLKLFAPGERAWWSAFRRDRLVHGSIDFTDDPNPELEMRPLENPTAEQRSAFASWTGFEWSRAWTHLEGRAPR